MNNEKQQINLFISTGNIVLLFLALAHLPYVYYKFLRITLFASGIYFINFYQQKSVALVIIFMFITILYNPIIPIYLTRDIWTVLNILTVGVMALNLYFLKKHEKKIL